MASNIYASAVTIYSATPGAGLWLIDCQSTCNTGAGTITLTVTVGGRTIYGAGVAYTKSAGITSVGYPVQVLAAAAEAVTITIQSSNASDTAVTLNTPTAVLQAVNTSQVSGTAQTAKDIGAAVPAYAPGAANGLPIISASGSFLNVANLPQVAAGAALGLPLNDAASKVAAKMAAGDGVDSAALVATVATAGSGLTRIHKVTGNTPRPQINRGLPCTWEFDVADDAQVLSATEHLTNGDFETLTDAGPPANFGTWTETVGSGGQIEAEGVLVHGGSYSAKLTQGTTNTSVMQTIYNLVPGKRYRLTFWTAGDGTHNGRSWIYDPVNVSDVLASAATGVTGATMTQVTRDFVCPNGCRAANLYLHAGTTGESGEISYFDDASVKELYRPVYTVTLTGPDPAITKTAPTPYWHRTAGRYTVSFTPDELGPWMLSCYDYNGDLVYSQSFECVDATVQEHAMGIQNSYKSTVTVWPTVAVVDGTTPTSSISQDTATTYCYVSTRRWVVPYDGLIYGLSFYGYPTTGNLTSLRFFTAALSGGVVRGLSEDLIDLKPVGGSWGTGWQTINFNKPIPARQGDTIGFEVVNKSGSAKIWGAQFAATTNPALSQQTKIKTSALTLAGGTNTWSTWGAGVTDLLGVKILMRPPAIALGGLSLWAGCYDSDSVFADQTPYAYVAAQCPGYLLSQVLGVPVVNCSVGSSWLTQWIGAAGYYIKNIQPLHPAVLLFDTTINDYSADPDHISNEILALDELLALCDSDGVRLVHIETHLCKTINDNGHVVVDEAVMEAVSAWCQANNVLEIPLNFRLCQHSGGTEHAALRRILKTGPGPGGSLPSYNLDDTHATLAGRKAIAMALGNAFRPNAIATRTYMARTSQEEVMPEHPMVVDVGVDGVNLTGVDVAKIGGTTQTGADVGGLVGTVGAAGAGLTAVALTSAYDAAKTAASQTSVTAISTILSGITSLAAWLRGLMRSSAMDATAKSEVNSGGGTYNETTDSLEAQETNSTPVNITSETISVLVEDD